MGSQLDSEKNKNEEQVKTLKQNRRKWALIYNKLKKSNTNRYSSNRCGKGRRDLDCELLKSLGISVACTIAREMRK